MERNNEVVLAIFPFENLTEGNALEIFCKSFYYDLVTELSRFRQFRILAKESVQDISGMTTDYFIKGSFRYHKDVLRINAQLVNNKTNAIAWADRYEGGKESIFSIQEDLLKEIVSTLQQRLNYDLLHQIHKKSPINLTAYEYWLYGMEELKNGSLEADKRAREHFQSAIDLDPQYSLAYSGMSLTYFNEWSCQLWERWDVSQKGAFEWAKKASDLDAQDYVAALVLGRIYLYEAEYEIAEHYLRKALRLNPNDIDILVQVASCFVFLGYIEEAEDLYDKVLCLNPLHVTQYHFVGSFIAFEKGDFERSVSLGSKSKTPWVDFQAMQAAAYFGLGDVENMNRCWNAFLEEFKDKILQGGEVDVAQAVQWIIDVSPYKSPTNFLPFWEFIRGEAGLIPSRSFSKTTMRPDDYAFLKQDELWRMSFDGRTIQMQEVKGFCDIAKLLEQPEKQIHCSELFGSSVTMNPEAIFDEKAKRSYQKRIQELQEEIRTAENYNDGGRLAALQQEYDDIVEHLTTSLGMKGKIRKLNDPIEKARSAVTWRIRNAIQKIEKFHPVLGKHLARAIKTGLFCSYSPEKEIQWELYGAGSLTS